MFIIRLRYCKEILCFFPASFSFPWHVKCFYQYLFIICSIAKICELFTWIKNTSSIYFAPKPQKLVTSFLHDNIFIRWSSYLHWPFGTVSLSLSLSLFNPNSPMKAPLHFTWFIVVGNCPPQTCVHRCQQFCNQYLLFILCIK